MSLATEWGRYGIRLNAIAPGEIPTEGHEQAPVAGRRSRRRDDASEIRKGGSARIEELQNLATFLMSDGCDWLSGETIAMDGAQALATGGNFYELRKWGDAEWQAAREAIQAQNAQRPARARRLKRRERSDKANVAAARMTLDRPDFLREEEHRSCSRISVGKFFDAHAPEIARRQMARGRHRRARDVDAKPARRGCCASRSRRTTAAPAATIATKSCSWSSSRMKGVDGFGASLHNAIVAPYILHYGSEEQKRRWLPRMATGELVGAIAMTEPGAGSDLQGVRTERAEGTATTMSSRARRPSSPTARPPI